MERPERKSAKHCQIPPWARLGGNRPGGSGVAAGQIAPNKANLPHRWQQAEAGRGVPLGANRAKQTQSGQGIRKSKCFTVKGL